MLCRKAIRACLPGSRRIRLSFTALLCSLSAVSMADDVNFLNQGWDWGEAQRQAYYTTDQGSELIPLDWILALEHAGKPFMVDHLARYGFLSNPQGQNPSLPIGFTVRESKSDGNKMLGLSCAACHTREIKVDGKRYRADGGPAIADFQNLLADLNAAVDGVLSSDTTFAEFAKRIYGDSITNGKIRKLRKDVEYWHKRFDALVSGSLPTPEWGPSRLDAVSMIFNRLTGISIGKKRDDYIIRENIVPADAPTRYPFLWNAARQDYTQWPGFAENGNNLLGLARNLGEVYGVFATFHPKKIPLTSIVNYMQTNSANFDGLGELENLVWKIGPPEWPWDFDEKLVQRGYVIYNLPTRAGGCVECHGIKPGKLRSLTRQNLIWATPILDVGTDSREYNVLAREVDTGVLAGTTAIPGIGEPLKKTDLAFNALSTAVLGSIAQHKLLSLKSKIDTDTSFSAFTVQQPEQQVEALKGAFGTEEFRDKLGQMLEEKSNTKTTDFKYESRVLEGIWAAAPYLHNGSVPTLADLLKPVAERPTSFKIGPNYDLENVGLAAEQPEFDYVLATGCEDRNSGNSNCGHEYGTELPEDDKRALLEYLKVL